jgi:hypothetical protein
MGSAPCGGTTCCDGTCITSTGVCCPTNRGSNRYQVCGTTCADTQNDPENCNVCGNACGAGNQCIQGRCCLQAGMFCESNSECCSTLCEAFVCL